MAQRIPMSSHRWPWQGPTLAQLLAPAMGVTWALAMGWVMVIAARDHHPAFSSEHQCGTDPSEILRAGEMLDASTLRFVLAAHCGPAHYGADGRIVLRYGGAPVDIETRTLDIGGAAYVQIVSVGGAAHP